MARYGAVDIAGKSGASYRFIAYSLDTIFQTGRAAVYAVTRRREGHDSSSFKHRKIGIDQTADLRRLLAGCTGLERVRGANCICVHDESNPQARLAIQNDLRKS